MKHLRNAIISLAVFAALGGGAWAQMMGRGGMGMRTPQVPGVFKASVGDGAEYRITTKEATLDVEYAIVGKETVDGQDAYWQETRMVSGPGAGMISKQLMVWGGPNPGIKRMIVQPPGQQAMEMPMNMMGSMMMRQPAESSSPKSPADMGEMVGTETVTVPAGTFDCKHYRAKGAETVDAWVSAKVYPYGVVKGTTQDGSFILQKVLSNQTSHIKGEVKKMEMEMPHF